MTPYIHIMRIIPQIVALASIPMAMHSCSTVNNNKLEYPEAPSDNTVDIYFGMEAKDTFRPLENDTAANTLAWVEAENAVTQAYLSNIPYREKLRQRLTALNDYKKIGMPWKWNDGNYYFYENDGLKNQSVLYRVEKLGDTPEIFLDPNSLSEDGTVALTGVSQSPDGKYTAYKVSRSGSDWTEIYVMDTKSKKLLPDHIEWAKFTGVAWHKDGFYYSAYPRPKAGKEYSNANEYHSVYYHKLGCSQSDDVIAYEDKENPLYFHSVYVPEGQPYIFIIGGGQGIGESIKFKRLDAPNTEWTVIEPSQDIPMSIINVIDGNAYLYTSLDAPRYRIVSVPLSSPSRENWKEIVAEDPECVLIDAQFSGKDKLLLTYDQAGTNHLFIHSRDGKRIKEIEMPSIGSIGLSASNKYPEAFYSFTSFNYPATIYSLDTSTGDSELYKSTILEGFNPDDYVVEQVFYPSSDGTSIPMYLTYKKGLERNGGNPVYLYGYGGFNVTLNPGFSANRLLWLENGGIYAQAGLRGGAEYGDEWHEAGTKMKKLNVFNDFISAAEYLVKENWTNPELLTIEGGSNGGLLVGATVNMRPDLFKVAIPRVGVMDMMRYHLFTIGWNWASDYGTSADSKEMAKYLLDYSPIHNIKNDGTKYPAIMVTTADHDDRVVPAHSFKYAATLQASNTGDAPKLIRIDSKAGHGAGKPISKVIDEYADIYSFIFYNLGVTPNASIEKATAE